MLPLMGIMKDTMAHSKGITKLVLPDLFIANIELCKDNIVVPVVIHKVISLNKPIVK